jgi:xyloglucan-specific exo-beta-1,4-glucanase
MIALPFYANYRPDNSGALKRLTLRIAAVAISIGLAQLTLLPSLWYPGAARAAAPESTHYIWNNVAVGGGGFSPNIIFSPVQQGLAYLRTDIGGLYRYDPGAQRWIPLQDDMAEGNYFGVESVAPDPRDANVVYAAVGMYGSGPAAILRSDNRGVSWNIFSVPFRMGGNEDGRGLGERLAVDPHATHIVYFGSRHDGLQRSADRGRSWSRVAAFPVPGLGAPEPRRTHAGISFVLFDLRGSVDGAPTKTIFAGVADAGVHHLYRSNDAGASWHAIPQEPRADLLPVRAQLDANGILYLAYCNGIGPNGITDGAVFKLDTATDTWHDITPSLAGPQPLGGFMGLALDPRQPGTVLVATVDWWQDRDTIWRSTDGGSHWMNLRPLSETDATASPFLRWGEARANFGWWMAGLAIDPFDSNHLAYTTGATVYNTDTPLPAMSSPSIRWRPWVSGIEETAILALVSPPQGPPLLSGFGDIGGFVHEDLRRSPPTMYTDPIFNNTDVLDYAGLAPSIVVRSGRPRRGANAMAWSQNFGESWTPLQPSAPGARGAPTGGSASAVAPATRSASAVARATGDRRVPEAAIAVSADGATFIAMGQDSLFTRDRGRTWNVVQGLPEFARAVADRVDPQRFYALDFEHSRIFSSADGGASFAAVASRGLPTDLRVERPRRPETPWPLLATPGKAGDLWLVNRGDLYHSANGGRRFALRRSDLAVTALAFGKPQSARGYPTLYAIGLRGELNAIWRSDDAGASWLRINDAEHEYGRRFRVIAGDPRVFGRVYVGTDGRGLFYGEPAP